MLDRDKLWIGIIVKTPHWLPIDEKAACLRSVAEKFHFDESVMRLVMHQDSYDDGISTMVECIYDPKNGNDEKYNEFFEEAKKYVEEFNKIYNINSNEES